MNSKELRVKLIKSMIEMCQDDDTDKQLVLDQYTDNSYRIKNSHIPMGVSSINLLDRKSVNALSDHSYTEVEA